MPNEHALEPREPASPAAQARAQLEKMHGQFLAALPEHIPVERFMRVVMTALQGNPKLLECARQSLFSAAMKAAQDGLLPDGREAALVEYKGQVQYLPMIAGMRKKVRNSGDIATWDVHAVYANDAFDYELGDEPFIKHKPSLSQRGPLIAVYSVATLKGGAKSRDVMSVEDVERIRAKSRAQSGPWSDPTFYPEMAKKTVARRHAKVLPMSTDLDDLLRRDDALYDLPAGREGASSAPVRASLGQRLAALASPDGDVEQQRAPSPAPEEATLDDDEREEPEARWHEPTARLDAEQADAAQASPEAERVEAARLAGWEAARSGVSRRGAPQNLSDPPSIKAAWQQGWDESKGAAS
jgi:recombination protein RecT